MNNSQKQTNKKKTLEKVIVAKEIYSKDKKIHGDGNVLFWGDITVWMVITRLEDQVPPYRVSYFIVGRLKAKDWREQTFALENDSHTDLQSDQNIDRFPTIFPPPHFFTQKKNVQRDLMSLKNGFPHLSPENHQTYRLSMEKEFPHIYSTPGGEYFIFKIRHFSRSLSKFVLDQIFFLPNLFSSEACVQMTRQLIWVKKNGLQTYIVHASSSARCHSSQNGVSSTLALTTDSIFQQRAQTTTISDPDSSSQHLPAYWLLLHLPTVVHTPPRL